MDALDRWAVPPKLRGGDRLPPLGGCPWRERYAGGYDAVKSNDSDG